ncbi:MAG: pilus assembly protein PilM [Myxococcota bacterium]
MAREKLCVGIDIGASAIKLCQLKKSKKGFVLEHFGMLPLPPEAVVDGALMNTECPDTESATCLCLIRCPGTR